MVIPIFMFAGNQAGKANLLKMYILLNPPMREQKIYIPTQTIQSKK